MKKAVTYLVGALLLGLVALTPASASAGRGPIDPANFVRGIDNPFFPLKPGTTFIYHSEDGAEVVETAVTYETIDILGVACVVVEDVSTVDGKLEERTHDYFAQDKDGNVWYFGEATTNFKNGRPVNTVGSWRAGKNGASPGIIMEASPNIGDRYNEENAAGVAEDGAEVISLDTSVKVPFGSFDHALQTAETTPLEPKSLEHKYYVRGVGQVLAVDVKTGEREQLVRIENQDASPEPHDK